MEQMPQSEGVQNLENIYDFRDATLEDLPSLSKLSLLTSAGIDFLVTLFPHLIQSPGWYFFTATEKATQIIVAVTAMHVFDEGKTLTYRFTRIHPEHQSRGLVKAVKAWAFERVCKFHGVAPSLNRSLVLRSYLQSLTKKGIQVRRLSSTDMLFCKVDLKSISMVNERQLESCHLTEMIPYPEFLSNPSFCKHKAHIMLDNFLTLDGDIFNMEKLTQVDVHTFSSHKLHMILTTEREIGKTSYNINSMNHDNENSNNNNDENYCIDFVATLVELQPNKFDNGLPGLALNVTRRGNKPGLLHDHCMFLLKLYEWEFGSEGEAGFKVICARGAGDEVNNSTEEIFILELLRRSGVNVTRLRDDVLLAWAEIPV